MPTEERRRPASHTTQQLRTQLNELQLDVARQLERFGWDLRFIRKAPFQPAMPVMSVDSSFLALREDGTMDDLQPIALRQDK